MRINVKMKHWNIKFLPVFALILGVMIIGYTSCKPEHKDYRENWVGKYTGLYEWGFYAGTYHNGGEEIIEVLVSSYQDSSLLISLKEDKYTPKVDKNGYFFIELRSSKYCEGKVFKDSISILVNQISPGAFQTIYFNGKKQ